MSDRPPGNDRRHFKRIHFDCDAFIEEPSGTSRAVHLLDISLNGALVSKPDGWTNPGDQPLRLRIVLSGEETEICMECSVAHEEKEVIGFRCLHIDIDSVAHLRRIVELNLGDPELLNRELTALAH
ncbi:MAG: PilZ domain-containing protein [Gammaproteobacteria bacterium]